MKITDDILTQAVEASTSVAGVLRYLGKKEAGGSHSHYSRRIKRLCIDISHFTGNGWNKGLCSLTKKTPSEILILRTDGDRRQKPSQLRRAIKESGVNYECNRCGQGPEWLGNAITLDVDHINEKLDG